MKFLVLCLALLSTTAFADRKGAPFHPHDDKRFDAAEDRLDILDAFNGTATEGAAFARKYARVVYDVSVDGGASIDYDTGVDLPAGAVVTAVMVYINTAFTDGSTASPSSVALQCYAADDLMGLQQLESFSINTFFFGRPAPTNATATSIIARSTSATSTYKSIPSACDIVVRVGSTGGLVPLTAGKFTAVIEYFNKN
jgi:hypothetical protein